MRAFDEPHRENRARLPDVNSISPDSLRIDPHQEGSGTPESVADLLQ